MLTVYDNFDERNLNLNRNATSTRHKKAEHGGSAFCSALN
ncbi:hypothetical protein OS145_01887 [Idiomarina baltica OS145]|uniref:Uncharacterized protein n=1 Tax=Idiomarina baltica OS145 TaxID=314276 RepID=A0ABM9WPF9_9GAMM|nr:hypothetical protein OS145_01887 [Idiomarina baltica OS145]